MDGLRAILWAPSDSDRIYSLRLEPLDGLGEPFEHGPVEIGEHVEAIGGGPGTAVLASRIDGRAVLSRISFETGARADSIGLPLGESFTGGGLVSEARAIVASDRAVYLFDLMRELYLLDVVALPGRGESPEGAIAARGDRVYVAGEGALWIVGVR